MLGRSPGVRPETDRSPCCCTGFEREPDRVGAAARRSAVQMEDRGLGHAGVRRVGRVDGPLTFPAWPTPSPGCSTRSRSTGPPRRAVFGGMVAQHAALAHRGPCSASLTLLSTSPAFGLDGTGRGEWRAARLAPLDAGQEPADFAGAVLPPSPARHHARRRSPASGRRWRGSRGDALRRAIDCLVTHDMRGRLRARSTAPTLVLVGALDQRDTAHLRAGVRRPPAGAPLRGGRRGRPPARRRGAGRGQRAAASSTSARSWRHGMTEWRWIRSFADHLERCDLLDGRGRRRCSASRPAGRAGRDGAARGPDARRRRSSTRSCRPPRTRVPVPIRSTGASQALAGQPRAVVAALAAADLVHRLHGRGAAARAGARAASWPAARAC